MKTLVRRLTVLLIAALMLAVPRSAHAEKLRDLCDVSGARENQLIGFGIVTGLQGTGDDLTVPFTSQTVLSLLRRLGIQVDPAQLMLRNVAAVIVTATIPAFAAPGTKMDITVGSIGNARSLAGGVLVQTLLKGPDQKTYAVGQGSIVVGNFAASGQSGSTVKSGSTTNAGRIPEGAIVERAIPAILVTDGALKLVLRTPGFAVAAKISDAVNKSLGDGSANAPDAGTVVVKVPQAQANKVTNLIAQLEEIEVTPVRRARVVINERTGTIVAGGDVRLSASAVVHGGLTIVVKETPQVSQPNAFAQGNTVVTPQSDVNVTEDKSVVFVPAAPTLADVAGALGRLGLPPRELGSVLQAMRAAGALEAELVVQ